MHYVRGRGRQRHHPVLSIVATAPRGRAGQQVHAALRQPHHDVDDVPRGARRPEGPPPGPVRLLSRPVAREAGTRDLLAAALDAERLPRRCSRRCSPPETVDEWFLCGPFAMVEDLRSTLGEVGVDPRRVHRELFYTGNGATGTKRPSRNTGRSSRERLSGHDPPRRPGGHVRARSRRARRSSTARCGSETTPHTHVVAESARHAGPAWSRARSRWITSTRSRRTRRRPATYSPASPIPPASA